MAVRSGPSRPAPADIALIGVVMAAGGLAGFGWLVVEAALIVSGHPPTAVSAGGLAHGLAAWAAHPGRPGAGFPMPIRRQLPDPAVMYLAVAVVAGVMAAVAVGGWRLARRAGLAGGGQARQRERAQRQRRGLADPARLRHVFPAAHRQAGGLVIGVGRHGRHALTASPEATLGVICPPRTGKSSSAIGHILDAPGCVLATSSKPELLLATAIARQHTTGQPCLAYDPLGVCGWDLPVRWNPIAGCDDPKVAMRRAEALVAGTSTENLSDGGFWRAAANILLRCCLHAAALDRAGIDTLRGWVAAPANGDLEDAVALSPVARGWLKDVELMVRQNGETLEAVALTTAVALDCLALPEVIDCCSPTADQAFDPAGWLAAGRGTLQVVAPDAESASVAPLTAALVDEVIIAARAAAAATATGRLDPPLRLVLDELANICPLPKVATYVTDAGGRGIQVAWYAQARSQLLHRFGPHTTATLLGATTVMCFGGGLVDPELLRDVSSLIGTIAQTSRLWGGDHTGGRSWSEHLQHLPVMDPADIFELRPFEALALTGGVGATIIKLLPWWRRPDARSLHADRQAALRRTGRATS